MKTPISLVQSTQSVKAPVVFYHGGESTLRAIRNVQGIDGELLCASESVNVAKRYGAAITKLSLNDVAVKTMTQREWFSPKIPLRTGEMLTDRLRDQGVAAVVVKGDPESYDFPADTLFILDVSAATVLGGMSEAEVLALDDGSSWVMDPAGPGARGWKMYARDFGGDPSLYSQSLDLDQADCEEPVDEEKIAGPGM